ncbi:MAG: hypothetical protein JO121_08900 [Deltaproteobacteria bacterium]|nr:hypothetical protein [Deltaproteobacteria bacterium]
MAKFNNVKFVPLSFAILSPSHAPIPQKDFRDKTIWVLTTPPRELENFSGCVGGGCAGVAMAIHRTGAPWDARPNAGDVSVGVAGRGAGRDGADAATKWA